MINKYLTHIRKVTLKNFKTITFTICFSLLCGTVFKAFSLYHSSMIIGCSTIGGLLLRHFYAGRQSKKPTTDKGNTTEGQKSKKLVIADINSTKRPKVHYPNEIVLKKSSGFGQRLKTIEHKWLSNLKDCYADFEPKNTKNIANFLRIDEILNSKQDTLIIDIGAHIGDTSLWIAALLKNSKKSSNIKVLAIDPDPSKIDFIEKMASANGLSDYILTHTSAVGDKKCDVKATTTGTSGMDLGGALIEYEAEKTENSLPMDTLDNILTSKNLSRSQVGMIHLSVEGWDLRVLQGANQTITRYKPEIFAKLNWVGASNASELRKNKKAGYWDYKHASDEVVKQVETHLSEFGYMSCKVLEDENQNTQFSYINPAMPKPQGKKVILKETSGYGVEMQLVKHKWTNNFAEYYLNYEPKTNELIAKELQIQLRKSSSEAPIIVDAGAHVGDTALWLAARAIAIKPNAIVVAIEPDSSKIQFMEHMAIINKLANNMRFFNGAVGKNEANVQVVPSHDTSEMAQGGSTISECKDGPIVMKSMDGIFEQLKLNPAHVAFVHIDTEGFEADVIHGMQGIIDRSHPSIMAECNWVGSSQATELKSKLSRNEHISQGEWDEASKNCINKIESLLAKNNFFLEKTIHDEESNTLFKYRP